jgi:hypothetical protein
MTLCAFAKEHRLERNNETSQRRIAARARLKEASEDFLFVHAKLFLFNASLLHHITKCCDEIEVEARRAKLISFIHFARQLLQFNGKTRQLHRDYSNYFVISQITLYQKLIHQWNYSWHKSFLLVGHWGQGNTEKATFTISLKALPIRF